MMANILQMFFYVFLAFIIFGDTICQKLGITTPDFVKSMMESKMMYSVGGFFIFAQISQHLRSTGAFEISVNDDLVYSKLETGEMVDAQKLHHIFEPYGIGFLYRSPTP